MGKGMRAGRKPKPAGGGNMQKQMQAMQQMQAKMEALQEEINEMETTASSGGGAVSVKVNGKKELVEINLLTAKNAHHFRGKIQVCPFIIVHLIRTGQTMHAERRQDKNLVWLQ